METMRTTVALPNALLSRADKAIRAGRARSRNELLATALRELLERWEHETVDAAFREMASDAEYHREALRIAAEFERADAEVADLARGGE